MSASFPADPLARLSARILKGDVVFFIGSGASLDSERLYAGRLMVRLLLRLLAFAGEMEFRGMVGEIVRKDLVHTFRLKGSNAEENAGAHTAEAAIDFLHENITVLAKSYYEANEWFCSAFTCLLEAACELNPEELAAGIERREERLREGIASASARRANEQPPILSQLRFTLSFCNDPVPLDRLEPKLLAWVKQLDPPHRRLAGKALFLDTMGFQNPKIMGGLPGKETPFRDVERSYEGRLFPRHHVLARLAREGLCTSVLTTNFDLLIEGAFRLAGFSDNTVPASFPQTLVADFQTIASPEEFFAQGKAYREAIVVKMHGCALHYRNAYFKPENGAKLEQYLPSMVFTYREIQNWREDSWAADYLRTLLRTRVVVFCGYSLQDPVIHDTFRTVYEEMARVRSGPAAGTPENAPAYFFAPAGNVREFHGMAVLRAATAAVGAPTAGPGEHPNYLPFHFRDASKFPSFDESMRWLFHLVFRSRQLECLKSDLRRITTLLLGGPRPEAELAAVRAAFKEMYDRELATAQQWDEQPKSRLAHTELCAWTELFHVGLLREFACGDVVRQRQGAGVELGLMRRLAWYYPAMQDASWTCWGAVVELALRAMAAQSKATITVGDCRRPTVLIRRPGGRSTPHGLTIQFGGFERVGLHARLLGALRRRVFWELGPGDAPWRRTPVNGVGETAKAKKKEEEKTPREVAREILRAPDAEFLWRWASVTPTDFERKQADLSLGFYTRPAS